MVLGEGGKYKLSGITDLVLEGENILLCVSIPKVFQASVVMEGRCGGTCSYPPCLRDDMHTGTHFFRATQANKDVALPAHQ